MIRATMTEPTGWVQLDDALYAVDEFGTLWPVAADEPLATTVPPLLLAGDRS